MSNSSTSMDIYQLKISLKRIKPPVWRRVQMSKESTFAELHHVIVCSMGWSNSHLHMYTAPRPKGPKSRYDSRSLDIVPMCEGQSETKDGYSIVIKEEGRDVTIYFGEITLDEAKTKLGDYFKTPKDFIEYVYDLGSSWHHIVVLEKILPSVAGKTYPVLVTGRRACPPEDPTESEEEDAFQHWKDAVFDPKSVTYSRNCYRKSDE